MLARTPLPRPSRRTNISTDSEDAHHNQTGPRSSVGLSVFGG
jgi:hypothetical protein